MHKCEQRASRRTLRQSPNCHQVQLLFQKYYLDYVCACFGADKCSAVLIKCVASGLCSVLQEATKTVGCAAKIFEIGGSPNMKFTPKQGPHGIGMHFVVSVIISSNITNQYYKMIMI
jgi:hypothetical protein